jgi:YD repeat-containing protein
MKLENTLVVKIGQMIWLRKVVLKVSILSGLIGFVLTNNLHAQDVNEPYKFSFVPPSPIAASLGQYGEIPVSYYTGTPSIDIPIWEVKGRDLSVPISVSYHASGIKVDQRDGMMGLGWALNAGGVITRTIMGKNDEYGGGVGYRSIFNSLNQYMTGSMTSAQAFTFENNCASGMYDTEPDEYYYNFVGRSGKLVFDHNGIANLIPNNKYQITGNVNIGFTVITEDGVKYTFDEIGQSSIQPPSGETIGGNTSWFLKRITSVTGDQIDFSYVRSQESYDLTMSETRKVKLLSEAPPSGASACQDDLITRDQNMYLGDRIELSEISSVNTLVKITKDKIQIFDKSNLLVPIKEFEFTYSFFGPGPSRLKLESIREVSGGVQKPPYEFFYNDLIPPDYNSLQQDHWGFFNQNTAETLVPEAILGTSYFEGANREQDSDLTKMCLLKQIKYPTGGRTEFDFESHDYSYIGVNPVLESILEGTSIQVAALGVATVASPFITIAETQVVTLQINMDSQIIEQDAAGTVFLDQEHSYALLTDGPSNQTIKFVLQPGSYNLNIESFWAEVNITATLTYKNKIGETNIAKAGGVRIKRILNYSDNSSTPTSTKKFEYKNGIISSGVLGSKPDYFNYNYTYKYNVDLLPYYCYYFIRTSRNSALLGLTHGSHIGYQFVTQFDDEIGVNGKTVYEYTTAIEFPDHILPNVSAVTSFDYKRGLLKNKSEFAYLNGAYSKINETRSTYTFREDVLKNQIIGFKAAYQLLDQYGTYPDGTSDSQFFTAHYYNNSQWLYKSSVEEINYSNGIQLSKMSDFSFDNPAHMQITAITTKQSDGQISKSEFKYASELSNTDLLSRNMQSQVLNTKMYNAGTLTSNENIGYQVVNSMVVPVLHEVYPAGGIEKTILNYTYDDFGNIIQAVKDSNYPVSFIYGYNNSLPVVKGINITRSALLDAYNYAIGTSNFELNLRSHPSVEGALLTTYKYNALYGLVSQTDENGRSVYYEYDNLGRLVFIRDHDGNILKEYKYHYQNQN